MSQGDRGSRLAYLLGEMRRQMNGAVVGSMRLYGAEYGLNYGVSIATIRSIARAEGVDHRFAKLLYQQQVRELRLAALWLADGDRVAEELEFWAAGIINTEVAEEAAFALLHRVEAVDGWLESESELLRYCAVMSIAKSGRAANYLDRVAGLFAGELHILPKGVVVLLDSALNGGVQPCDIKEIIESVPESQSGAKYLREEMAWRLGEL